MRRSGVANVLPGMNNRRGCGSLVGSGHQLFHVDEKEKDHDRQRDPADRDDVATHNAADAGVLGHDEAEHEHEPARRAD